MSLKCSLLGHRFDESAVEHDREEDGSEVVIVTTELEACTRCGETRVVSENKEVRTTEAPEADADVETAGAETAEVPSAGSTADSDAVTDDAVLIDDADDTPPVEEPSDTTVVDETGETTSVDETDDVADTAVADDAAETDTTAESTGAELIDGAGSGEATEDTGDVDDATASAPSDDGAPADDDATTDDVDTEDTTDPAEEDAEILGSDDAGTGSADAEGDAQAQARGEPTEIPDAEAGASVADVGADADDGEVTDDAVIIDGDSGDERDPGEWPEESPTDETADEPAEESDERTDVEEIDDDSVVWSGESDAEQEEARSGSADAEWPEAEAGEEREGDDGPLGEWPDETVPDGTDDADAGPTLEQAASPTVTVPEGMYKCPECGFTADVESSPHRAGDFCPECHHGTLVQDEDSGN